MASPFFTPINVNQSDFSPILRGAESYGRSVGAGLASIGEAVGKVANSYFEEKGFEEQASDFMMTPDGQEFLKKNKLSAESREDALKFIKGAIKSQGGFKEFKAQLMKERELQMAQDAHKKQQEINQQVIDQNNFAIQALEKTTYESAEKQNLFSQAFKRGDDGSFTFDIGNIKTTDKNAYLLPDIYKQAKDMGLMGGFNYSKWKNDLIKNGAWDASDRQGMSMLLGQTMSIHNDISAEDQKRYQEMIGKETYDVGQISEEAQKWWNATPNAKTWMQAEETSSMLKSALSTAIGTRPNGEQYVKNAPSASLAIRQFARLANGAGVMTDKDVSSVAGATDYESVLSRLVNKYFGEERLATQEDVDAGMADKVGDVISTRYGSTASLQDLQDIQKAMVFLEEKNMEKLRQHGEGLQNYLAQTFTGVPEERLLALSPFSQYWHRDHNFTINEADLPSAHRLIKTQGVDAFISQIKQLHPEIKDAQLAKIVNQVNNYVAPDQYSPVNQYPKTENFELFMPEVQEIDNSSREKVGEDYTAGEFTRDVATGSAGGFVGKWMNSNLARGNTLEAMGEPHTRYREGLKAFDKAPMKEVKEYGKMMDVDRKDFKSDKAFRAELKKRFKNEIKGEVAKYLAKRNLPKKIIQRIVGGTLIGGAIGTAVSVGSLLYDLYDLADQKKEMTRENLEQLRSKRPKGSKEREVLDEMIRELDQPRNKTRRTG